MARADQAIRGRIGNRDRGRAWDDRQAAASRQHYATQWHSGWRISEY